MKLVEQFNRSTIHYNFLVVSEYDFRFFGIEKVEEIWNFIRSKEHKHIEQDNSSHDIVFFKNPSDAIEFKMRFG